MLAVQARWAGRAEGEDTMKKLQTFALAAFVATTIGVGSLATAPAPAHAAPLARIKCSDALKLSNTYIVAGDLMMAYGNVSLAAAYYGRAQAVTQAAC
jgi:hypothetical protein